MKKGEDWKDQGFGWENMQPGIYDKIEKAQPDFFQKRKRRYLIFWLFGFIIIGALAFLLFSNHQLNRPGFLNLRGLGNL